ncbi:MAG: efflux RND transporter periplasmic adaptor subunit [Candidatus Omnitrophica bacterium]|nr:efflux RND transporter periplasmic adaptor subunit [Candidatus Omnitrophota bacterium]
MPFKFPRLKIVLIVIGFLWVWAMIWMVGVTVFSKKKVESGKRKVERTEQEAVVPQKPAVKPREQEKSGKEKEASKAVVPVKVFKVERTDFVDSLPTVGTVKGLSEIDLRFEINGVVEKFLTQPGDSVGKGEPIAELNQKDLRLKLAHARSKLKSVESRAKALGKKLEIHQKLFDVGAIIKDKLEEVELDAESAKLEAEASEVEVEFAEEELTKTSLTAPKDGVMGPREVEVGEFVTPNEKVASLLVIDSVFIEVGIIEKDIEKIRIGQQVMINVDSYPGIDFPGTVDSLYPVVEGRSRTLTTRIKVENPRALLLPGMFSRAKVTIFSKPNTLVFPSLALNKGASGYTVYVIKDEIRKGELKTGAKAKVEIRSVQVGYITTDLCQVNLGVREGEYVVIETQGELTDGAPVEIFDVQEYAK